MKKNRMMRLASMLLVAVMMTTCTISGTFAKYVTSVEATDTARVARWGINSTANVAFDLFDPSYGTTVNSQYGDNVIAPGTTKTEMVQLSYVGQEVAPEVDYMIDLDVVESSIGDNINANPNIKWSFNGSAWGTWDTMIANIEAYHQDVEANNLPTIASSGIEIKWMWAFDESDPEAEGNYDTWDTAMGNASPLETVKLSIKLTATQVD